jgi:hypothetical protein
MKHRVGIYIIAIILHTGKRPTGTVATTLNIIVIGMERSGIAYGICGIEIQYAVVQFGRTCIIHRAAACCRIVVGKGTVSHIYIGIGLDVQCRPVGGGRIVVEYAVHQILVDVGYARKVMVGKINRSTILSRIAFKQAILYIKAVAPVLALVVGIYGSAVIAVIVQKLTVAYGGVMVVGGRRVGLLQKQSATAGIGIVIGIAVFLCRLW